MSLKRHTTQHKDRREEKKHNEELHLLKRENHQLKRQVSRLTKEVNRLILNEAEREKAAQEETVTIEQKPAGINVRCGSCDSEEIKTVSLPIGTLKVCKNCGKREILKK